MKPNPKEQAVLENLEGGKLAKDGFLGDDPRPPQEIIRDDLAELEAAGLSQQDVAARMRALTKKGLEGLGSPMEANGYQLTVEDYMGWMSCPFRDNRRAAKRVTHAQLLATGETMTWSDMSIHLIDAHGFFQGIGSPYRLEPLLLAKFLKLLDS